LHAPLLRHDDLEQRHDDLLASEHADVDMARELAAAKLRYEAAVRDKDAKDAVLREVQADRDRLASELDKVRDQRTLSHAKLMMVTKAMRKARAEVSKLKTKVGQKDRLVLLEQTKTFEAVETAKQLRDRLDELDDNMPIGPPPQYPEPVLQPAESGDAPVPASSAAGDVPVPAPRTITGDPRNVRNVRRWQDNALKSLSHFNPAALSATIDAVHKKLKLGREKLEKDIRSLSANSLLDIVSPKVADKLQQAGAKRFCDSVQAHWSTLLCANIKFGSTLSRSKYNTIRKELSCAWDGNRGISVHQECLGVKFPRIASRYMIDKFVGEVKDELGLREFGEGLGACVDVRKLLAANTMESVEREWFSVENGRVYDQFGKDPEVIFMADGCTAHKGMKVTACGLVFPHGSAHPMSPHHTMEFACAECGDNNASLQGVGRPMVDIVNNLIANPEVVAGFLPDDSPVTCRFRVRATGDLAFQCVSACISTCNGPASCPYCVCPKQELDKRGKQHAPRTRHGILQRAHRVVGLCPCCGLMVTDTADGRKLNPKKETPLLHGPVDKELPVPHAKRGKTAGGDRITHLSLHDGISPGQAPPFDFEPDDWAACLLHARLCQVGGMFRRSVLSAITNNEHGRELWEFLDGRGFEMKKKYFEKSKKKLDYANLEFKSFGMAGSDTELLTELSDEMLALVYRREDRGPWVPNSVLFGDTPAARKAFEEFRDAAEDSDCGETFGQLCKARWLWKRWKDLWRALNQDPGETQAEWNAHADRVQALANVYVDAHIDLCQHTEGLYLHLLWAHVPDMIRRFGDLRLRQTQGLEHRHKLRKRYGLEASNRRKGQRIKTILTHVAVVQYLSRLRANNLKAKEHAANVHVKLLRAKAKLARMAALYTEYTE
jgi:hypothetical protein